MRPFYEGKWSVLDIQWPKMTQIFSDSTAAKLDVAKT